MKKTIKYIFEKSDFPEAGQLLTLAPHGERVSMFKLYIVSVRNQLGADIWSLINLGSGEQTSASGNLQFFVDALNDKGNYRPLTGDELKKVCPTLEPQFAKPKVEKAEGE